MDARAERATASLAMMTGRLVPTAALIGAASAATRAGTARKPPPTPRNPVTAPSAAPAPVARGADAVASSDGVRRRSMRSPANMARAANAMVGTAAGMRADSRPAAAANSRPARQRTIPARAGASGAVSEVTITMIRLAVVASAGLKPSR
ncbi:hypothetical protein AMK29_20755 [Streptomyces sp. CB02261]|nr:hypothetical protein AMK29_20755 [Streptomyces sp. CB02261]